MNEKSLDTKCPSCGAPIHFNPQHNKWICEYCKGEFGLEEINKKNNKEKKLKKETKEDNTVYKTYNCKNCGAEIITEENTSATFCVYCGSTALIESRLTGKFAPSKIIPFKKTKEEAIKAFQDLKIGRPLMPKLFSLKENIEKISGIYVPFWLYDYRVSGKLEATGTNVATWVSGEYQYKRVDIYKLVRDGEMDYKKIPIDGLANMPNDIMNSIEPFDYSELEDFNSAYLSGFLAEKFDVEGEDVEKETASRALNSTKEEMLSDMGFYQSKVIKENTLKSQLQNFEYVLLPVWFVNVKYNGKLYTFAQNAQTGKIIGNIPVDKKKAILYFLLIFVGASIFALLVIYYISKGGR